MKKLILVPAAGLLLFGGIAFANSNDGTEQDVQKQQPATTAVAEVNNAKEKIGFDEAERIAREIIDGQMTDIEMEREHNKDYYDIEMYANGYEYDIEVDAFNGEVLKNKREKENDFDDDNKAVNAQGSDQNVKSSGQSQEVRISADEAVKAALAVVSGEVEEVELEHDDGRVYYDIEIENRHEDHEVKVDATDGAILEVDTDIED